MIQHIVKQGEHLAGIAELYGFADYHTIWDDGANADLKKRRRNPNVLLPGDVVAVPERQLKIESGSTEQRHRFRVYRPPLKLRLKMERSYNTPLKNAECELLVDFDSTRKTTDGEGILETLLPRNAVNAHLTVTDSITLKGRQVPLPIRLPLRIGYLNPLDEPSGQKARLANLGYYRASVDEVDDDIDDDEFKSAVEEFQCEHALTVDGKCGGQTQAKLKEVHGC